MSSTDTEIRQADLASRRAAWILGLCLPADVVLYLLLPLHAAEFGVTLAQAGLLLAANRLVRIVGYGFVARFYARRGDRAICVAAACGSVVCATGYAMFEGFWWLVMLRLIWGLCFAGLNLSTQALATHVAAGAARRAGRSRAWIALAPMIALPLAAIAAAFGQMPAFFLILAFLAALAIPLAWKLPAHQGTLPVRKRRFAWPDRLDIWCFVEGLVLDGLFIVGLAILGARAMPDGDPVLIAGCLMALRYAGEILLSPLGGRLAQRFGAERMLVVLSMSTGGALLAYGAGWIWSAGLIIVMLRALQLPLVAPVVAQRYPGAARVHALAARAIWRDIGAGMGPVLAGLLLPVTPALLLYGLAGLLLAISAWATRQGIAFPGTGVQP